MSKQPLKASRGSFFETAVSSDSSLDDNISLAITLLTSIVMRRG